MIPTIGRIVHYGLGDGSTRPAMVVYMPPAKPSGDALPPPTVVDLFVFCSPRTPNGVPFYTPTDVEQANMYPPPVGKWTWPPMTSSTMSVGSIGVGGTFAMPGLGTPIAADAAVPQPESINEIPEPQEPSKPLPVPESTEIGSTDAVAAPEIDEAAALANAIAGADNTVSIDPAVVTSSE